MNTPDSAKRLKVHVPALILASALLAIIFSHRDLRADVRLPALMGDNMVLQRDTPARVWGWADAGEEVAVSVAGQKKTAVTGADGKWSVMLAPLSAAESLEMTIQGKNAITLKNVAVGEVWVCSGQSNMAFAMKNTSGAESVLAAASIPGLRLFSVRREADIAPRDDVSGKWAVSDSKTASTFSGVGWYFGRDLYEALGVPVGLIDSSWGGTPGESWTPEPALRGDDLLRPTVERWDKIYAGSPGYKENYAQYHQDYIKQFREYRVAFKKWSEAKKNGNEQAAGERPRAPQMAGNFRAPAVLYNSMIAPLTPLTIRGAIWYQGEANQGRGWLYRTLLKTMIAQWREAWGIGDFPFGVVQLPNFRKPPADAGQNDGWSEVREAQMMALEAPNTGLAVTIDLGDPNDIHPKNKRPVGERLAKWALATVYDKDIVYSGPLYESMSVEGDRIRLRFKHVGGGLVDENGGELKGFAIAGADKKYVWAEAKIDGDTVVVWSDKVKEPVAVRYAWGGDPEHDLFNKEWLTASPFRTEDWPGATFNKR